VASGAPARAVPGRPDSRQIENYGRPALRKHEGARRGVNSTRALRGLMVVSGFGWTRR
jgi:hypothetical protein